MKRHPMQWWKLAAPALLLAGITWSGVTAAQEKGDDKWDGPGGMSAPADPKDEKEGKKEGRRGRQGAMRRHHRADMMAQLDLSDRQKEQIRGIRQAQERRMIPLHADLKTAGLDLRELMQAERPNQARIDAAIDKLADLRADAHKERVKSMLAIRDLLTDEQRKKLKDARGGRGFGMPGMRGMHGMRGMGGHHGSDI